MFYYAVLNENMFVVDLVESETQITDSSYISITADQYTNGDLLWLYYSQGQFIVCDNFIGSSDWIIYKNTDRPITPKFDELDAQIEGKADSDHNHDGSYAALNHTHTEFATGTHNHDDLYAAKSHETNTNIHVTSTEKTDWNSKAAGNHNHDSEYAEISHAHTDYAGLNHTHNSASSTAAGFISAADKSKLDGIETGANLYTHPSTHPASMITGLPTSLPANGGNADTVDNCHASDFASATHDHDSDYAAINHNHSGTYATASHTHTEYSSTSHSHNTATTAAAGFMSGTDKAKLNGIAENANKYTHPNTHPASMITETDGLKIMTAAERTKLSGIAENANKYTHPSTHAASMITGLSTVATSGSYNDLSNKPTIPAAYTHPSSHPASMITGLASVATSGSYNDLSNKPSTFTPASHTHAQSEITGLSTALSGKANTSHTHTAAAVGAAAANHNHDSEYIPMDLLGLNSAGGVEYSFGSGSGKNVLTEISNMPQGIHTIYAITGTAGNPDSKESYRFFVHKTSSTIGWIMAYSAQGAVYANYQSGAGTFKGWKVLHDVERVPLWTGGRYMTADHTITPTKKLSECEHGYMLLWSDYDPDTSTINNTDFCTTMIPNRNWSGGTWNGAAYYCDIPRYTAGTATDSESRIIKVLYVYDNKLVGTENNKTAPRNDVVLRAVYEF